MPDKCQGGECQNDAKPSHACPFLEEIHDDSGTMCNCCEECTQECAWDI